MAENIPTHYSEEKNKGMVIVGIGAACSLVLLLHTIQFAPMLGWFFTQDFTADTWAKLGSFLGHFYSPTDLVEDVKYVGGIDITMMIVGFVITILVGAIPAVVAFQMNPYRLFDLPHGDARAGTIRDVRQMEEREQVGIEGGNHLHLGKWKGSGEAMRLIETLSVLVLAPPGTGKTATFVVPSIITTDGSSFIVNDPKPELFDMTSGWRSQIGHVFKIDWSATDKTKDANGNWLDPDKMVFYPRFNVLSPKLTPPAGTAERDTYLDAVANVMSPSAKGGGKSDYFEEKGRAAMVGFLHYICSKVNDARDYSGLPEEWNGREACIPMIIDMINEGLIRASQENDRKKEEAAAGGGFHQGDALSDWLKAIVAECRENHYNPRAATEITPLISMAPNERSGIMGTMDKAFIPFKNAAVRERTMSCDFVPADLRGIVDPRTGEMKPVTLYVCVNQAEAAAFATITSLLYEVFSREFLAYGPGDINRNNVELGPYPVCFMLDEFAKLPRIEAVMTGPDLGRSKKTYYCLVAQSDAQIGKLYSKEDQQIMYATTAVKYILPQNDKDTVGLVKSMVGPTTIKKNNKSMSRGGDMKEWGKSNISIAYEKVDFIRDGDVSGMKPGTHMLICQGFMNRPFWMDSVFYFKDPHIAPKVRARGHGPMPAPPLPEFIRQQRVEEWKRDNPDALPEVRIHVPGMGAMPDDRITLEKAA